MSEARRELENGPPPIYEQLRELLIRFNAMSAERDRYRAALERIAYADEFTTLNHSEDCRGMRSAAEVALEGEEP